MVKFKTPVGSDRGHVPGPEGEGIHFLSRHKHQSNATFSARAVDDLAANRKCTGPIQCYVGASVIGRAKVDGGGLRGVLHAWVKGGRVSAVTGLVAFWSGEPAGHRCIAGESSANEVFSRRQTKDAIFAEVVAG